MAQGGPWVHHIWYSMGIVMANDNHNKISNNKGSRKITIDEWQTRKGSHFHISNWNPKLLDQLTTMEISRFTWSAINQLIQYANLFKYILYIQTMLRECQGDENRNDLFFLNWDIERGWKERFILCKQRMKKCKLVCWEWWQGLAIVQGKHKGRRQDDDTYENQPHIFQRIPHCMSYMGEKAHDVLYTVG